MSAKNFLRDFKAYFTDIELTECQEKKIISLFESNTGFPLIKEVIIEVPKIREVYREVPISVSNKSVNDFSKRKPLNEIADEICKEYGITPNQLRMNQKIDDYYPLKKRSQHYVNARYAFIKKAYDDYNYQLVILQQYLGYKCHSSILRAKNGEFKKFNSYVKF